MTTGSSRPDDFKKSMQLTVDGYCIKPVSPSVMQCALEGARLGRRAMQR
jgi:DNA-binding NarL/FixJ family response regulator